jgi:hypothetical protein
MQDCSDISSLCHYQNDIALCYQNYVQREMNVVGHNAHHIMIVSLMKNVHAFYHTFAEQMSEFPGTKWVKLPLFSRH